MQPKSQSYIIFLVIGMAIILALGLALAISVIQDRPDVPEGMQIQIVEGMEIAVRSDPDQAVRLVRPAAPVVEQQPEAAAPEEAAPDEPADPPPTDPPPADPGVAAAPASVTPVIFIDHVVQASDTLFNLSQRYTTSIALMARYGISQRDLTPGNTIRLPVANPDYCPGRRPYVVMEGDTAFSIARKCGISAEELRAMNNLDEQFTVRVAEILCVP